jgi:hypothetical protein
MYSRTAARHFSSVSPKQFRLPSRSHPHPNGGPVKFYRVAIRKPPIFTRKRIINSFLYTAPLCALLYFRSPISIEVEVPEEEVARSDGTVGVEDDEDLEDGLFIPFGWPKKIPKTNYKRTDPEWQSYVKLARDSKRLTEIQGESWVRMKPPATATNHSHRHAG